ncbi:50S ribosomal protein L9 [Inmirania thermothiophila]|uniref:Large ribosomal subunit protein bL9 n=1 Tax=Inmirania thermothiophila TaxID=1750597 RepID=A0A3N1Y8T2_9GAMM|nr:50S ribosomal protein L9 [Inmirania thermothiophila]ROR35170.1 LSU ribosomal protein L9P [Inmirania thermothiophila]
MEVILLERVENLGRIGDRVRVRPGYARNYLIPKGKAAPATPENIAEFEKRRAELEAREAEIVAAARARAERLEGQVVRVQARVGGEGKLFGSVGTADIAEAASAQLGVEVERREVLLPEGPFRTIGEFEVELRLHSEVSATIRLVIEPEA